MFVRGKTEDDWELYGQAALQGEMESDSEVGSNESESVPTYFEEDISAIA